MRMVSNSNIPEPDFDLVPVTKLAWEDTKEFFSGLISGDLGTFQRQGGTFEVIEVMQDMYIKSMGLLGVALAAAAALGFLVGGFIALTRHRHLIAPLLTLTILGVSIPSFFGGFILQRTVAYYKDDYEFLRKLTLVGFVWDFRHMFIPVLVLSARPLAYITRSAFISLEHVMKEDFIRTAYAKGLRERWIVLDHAFRNIAVPVLTTLGVSLRFSLSSLPVVEFLFNWPGIGLGLITAINNRNQILVVALVFVLGITIQLVNFLLDIIYRIVDPRIREIS
ncbi:MAG: ABC transporter permease [Chloroflexi bacterium]|nr:ABC transporter permease [Chloroflexota bacterium]